MAVSHFPLGRICICGTRDRIHLAKRLGPHSRTVDIYFRRSRRSRTFRSRTLVGLAPLAVLRRVRLLAHESEFLSNSFGYVVGYPGGKLCVVPLGTGAMGLQPSDAAGTGFPA